MNTTIVLVSFFSEADCEIASLANDLQAPVMANDSDFYIFNIKHGYIPFEQYDFHGSRNAVKKFSFHGFTKHVRVDPSMSPLLGSLLGNDYISDEMLRPFCAHIQSLVRSSKLEASNKRCKVTAIVQFLSKYKSVPDAIHAVTGLFSNSHRLKFERALCLSIEEYQMKQSSLIGYFRSGDLSCKIRSYNGHSLPHWVIKLIRAGLIAPEGLACLCNRKIFLRTQSEDISLPSAQICVQDLRWYYYMLFPDVPATEFKSQSETSLSTLSTLVQNEDVQTLTRTLAPESRRKVACCFVPSSTELQVEENNHGRILNKATRQAEFQTEVLTVFYETAPSTSSTTQSTSRTTQSTSHTTQSTSRTTQSSNHTTQSTSRTTQSTNHTTQSTSRTTQSTSRTTQSTNHTTQSASRTTQSTSHTTQSTSRTTQSTNHTTKSKCFQHAIAMLESQFSNKLNLGGSMLKSEVTDAHLSCDHTINDANSISENAGDLSKELCIVVTELDREGSTLVQKKVNLTRDAPETKFVIHDIPKMPNKVKRNQFLSILHSNLPIVHSLPIKHQLVLSAMRYWIIHSHAKPAHVAALLVHYVGEKRDSVVNQSTSQISVKAVHGFSQWQNVVYWVERLNALFSSAFPQLPVSMLYNGSQVCLLYERILRLADVKWAESLAIDVKLYRQLYDRATTDLPSDCQFNNSRRKEKKRMKASQTTTSQQETTTMGKGVECLKGNRFALFCPLDSDEEP